MDPPGPRRKDGEESDRRGDDEDDEYRGDASAHAAVVLVLAGVHVADDVSLVRGVEVDVVGIERGGAVFLARHQTRQRHFCEDCL